MSVSNLLKRVDKELEITQNFNSTIANGISVVRNMIAEEYQEVISLRRINGLKPTLQSCTAKVYEEIGELMQLLGRGQKMSGELVDDLNNHDEWVSNTIGEALDGMQALNTLIYVLADENNIDIQEEVKRHEAKLVKKGYLVIEGGLKS